MEKVFDQIFVGSKLDVLDRKLLERNEIESIFSFEFVAAPEFIKSKYVINVADNQPVGGPWLGDAFGFLRAQTAMDRNVLVHCQTGISKSPSLVAGYLCSTYGIAMDRAVTLIKKKRPNVSPHPIFLNSIEDFVKSENARVMGI